MSEASPTPTRRGVLAGSAAAGAASLLSAHLAAAGDTPLTNIQARRSTIMTDLVQRTLHQLGERLPGRLSTPRDPGYADATAIWAKPVGRLPRAVVHCRTAEDVAAGDSSRPRL